MFITKADKQILATKKVNEKNRQRENNINISKGKCCNDQGNLVFCCNDAEILMGILRIDKKKRELHWIGFFLFQQHSLNSDVLPRRREYTLSICFNAYFIHIIHDV